MDRLALFAIGLVFGGGMGFLVAASNGITLDGHDHETAHGAAHEMSAGGHSGHDTPLDLAADMAPDISIMVKPDPVSGYNLHVTTNGFTFAPRAAGMAHVIGEGHAHVYVDGTKISRLYGEWMHIASLPDGEVEVEVTLNANDHRPLSNAGQLISAKAMVTVP
jgi:hypothetical protein